MKKVCALIALLLTLTITPAALAAPAVSVPNAVLIDAQNGLVLFEKNKDTRAYPASTTKIMTALLALEYGQLEDSVTVSFNAVNSISYDSSKAGLFEGEVLPFKDLVYALIVCSANDAANVIAEHVAGSVDAFVAMMNEKAAALGAVNTHFVNTHGLQNEEHYTTAFDLAIIARHAMSLPLFREITALRTYTIQPTNKSPEPRILNSTNHLTNPSSQYYYQYADGIKTGYTDAAKSCLVSSATANNVSYIAVVLGGGNGENGANMSFVDSRALLSYAVEYCKPLTLNEAGAPLSTIPISGAKEGETVPVSAASVVSVVLPPEVTVDAIEHREYIKKNLEAPVNAGDVLGRMEYWYNGIKVGQTYMTADAAFSKAHFVALKGFVGMLLTSIWTYMVLLALILVVMIVIGRRRRLRRLRRQRADMKRKSKYQ